MMDQGDQSDSAKNRSPPIPPRPNEQYNQQNFLATQRYNPYGMTSPYAMGPYGAGLNNPFGMQFMSSSVNQQIDTTFQSIQSIVQAFSSISMMLESTYMAVHSSFRAVMDVADHFIRLKDSLSGIMSVAAIFNTIKWFFRRIMYMFNMVSEDQIWNDSLASASAAIEGGQKSIFEHAKTKQSQWPMLMFLGFAVGAPYMIYQLQKPSATSSKWLTQEDCHYVGEALYDFHTTQDSEIPLKVGQKVIIAPKEQQPRVTDWLLATTDGKRAGLIPMNYVKIIKFEIVD